MYNYIYIIFFIVILPLRKYALPSIPTTVPLTYQGSILNNVEERDREILNIKKSWGLPWWRSG